MKAWIRALVTHWTQQPQLVMRPGNTPAALRARAEQLGLRLPAPLVELYRAVDGFDVAGETDEEGFSFWPLSRLAVVADDDSRSSGLPAAHRLLLFCDYLAFCWGYAIDCETGAVVMVGADRPTPPVVADDLPTFCRLYLADDARLYPDG